MKDGWYWAKHQEDSQWEIVEIDARRIWRTGLDRSDTPLSEFIVGPMIQREPEWQPIETAPKDGTLIDLYVPAPYPYPLEDEGHSVTIGYNNFINDRVDTWNFVGWDWCQDEFVHTSCDQPTHWRPRPTPPKTDV